MNQCSVCKYQHSYVSNHTHVYVCPACGSMLQKGIRYTYEKGPEQAMLPGEDMSPIELGTTLTHKGSVYLVIGRCRFVLNKGYRNKWLLKSGLDELFYLIEGYGFYGFCKKDAQVLTKTEIKNLRLETSIMPASINRNVYCEGIFKNVYTTLEGELTDPADDQLPFFAFDLTNPQGDYAFVQLLDKEHHILYTGSYYMYSDLQLSNHRTADEWK